MFFVVLIVFGIASASDYNIAQRICTLNSEVLKVAETKANLLQSLDGHSGLSFFLQNKYGVNVSDSDKLLESSYQAASGLIYLNVTVKLNVKNIIESLPSKEKFKYIKNAKKVNEMATEVTHRVRQGDYKY